MTEDTAQKPENAIPEQVSRIKREQRQTKSPIETTYWTRNIEQ